MNMKTKTIWIFSIAAIISTLINTAQFYYYGAFHTVIEGLFFSILISITVFVILYLLDKLIDILLT